MREGASLKWKEGIVLYSENIIEELCISVLRRKHLYASIELNAVYDPGINLHRPRERQCVWPIPTKITKQFVMHTPEDLRNHEAWVVSRRIPRRSRAQSYASKPTQTEHEQWICEWWISDRHQPKCSWRCIAEAACVILSKPHCEVTVADVLSKSNLACIVLVRQVVMYLLYHDLKWNGAPISLPIIGRLLGHRGHTTVLHGVKKIKKLLEHDVSLRSEIAQIRLLYT